MLEAAGRRREGPAAGRRGPPDAPLPGSPAAMSLPCQARIRPCPARHLGGCWRVWPAAAGRRLPRVGECTGDAQGLWALDMRGGGSLPPPLFVPSWSMGARLPHGAEAREEETPCGLSLRPCPRVASLFLNPSSLPQDGLLDTASRDPEAAGPAVTVTARSPAAAAATSTASAAAAAAVAAAHGAGGGGADAGEGFEWLGDAGPDDGDRPEAGAGPGGPPAAEAAAAGSADGARTGDAAAAARPPEPSRLAVTISALPSQAAPLAPPSPSGTVSAAPSPAAAGRSGDTEAGQPGLDAAGAEADADAGLEEIPLSGGGEGGEGAVGQMEGVGKAGASAAVQARMAGAGNVAVGGVGGDHAAVDEDMPDWLKE